MAILLVKIEDERSLALNEFYDYKGCCYASTRSRQKPRGKVIDMTNFYEAAVNTNVLHEIPVVFVNVENEQATVLGWYKKSEIFSKMHTPSLFLEGNIKAYTSDAVWLPEALHTHTIKWDFPKHIYEVIEEEDAKFLPLQKMITEYAGENQMIRYHSAQTHTIPEYLKNISSCRAACQDWANLVLEEKCQDIRDIKTLEAYARKLCEKDRKDSDGYYYLALASYQLGFVKEGLKQINKALQLEPDASDLTALKGLLLVSKGHVEDGADKLHQAYEKSQYELYLTLEKRARMLTNSSDFYHILNTN